MTPVTTEKNTAPELKGGFFAQLNNGIRIFLTMESSSAPMSREDLIKHEKLSGFRQADIDLGIKWASAQGWIESVGGGQWQASAKGKRENLDVLALCWRPG